MTQLSLCLWFTDNAEEAVNFYVDTFGATKGQIARYTASTAEVSGMPEGSIQEIEFTVDGVELLALNGGPQFAFTPAISFMVFRDTQDEIDAIWDKLCDGGEPMACGWVTDRFGVTWQVIPSLMKEHLASGEPEKIERMMQAMLTMEKLDVEGLRKAFEGE